MYMFFRNDKSFTSVNLCLRIIIMLDAKCTKLICCIILICSEMLVGVDNAKEYFRNEFCDVTCKEYPFLTLVCRRQGDCNIPMQSCEGTGGNVEFRQDVVYSINAMRNRVASGARFVNLNNPGAYQMNALSYDLELEYMAQCYVNFCSDNKEKCVGSKRFPYATGFLEKYHKDISEYITKYLFDKNDHLRTWERMRRFDSKDTSIYTFRSSLFENVKYIGCGAAKYNGKSQYLYYCLFGLTENPEGQRVFELASDRSLAGSKCKIRNEMYKYLCGNIEPIPTETAWIHRDWDDKNNDSHPEVTNPSSRSTHLIYNTARMIIISLTIVFFVCIIS